jgi:hypothetical protein
LTRLAKNFKGVLEPKSGTAQHDACNRGTLLKSASEKSSELDLQSARRVAPLKLLAASAAAVAAAAAVLFDAAYAVQRSTTGCGGGNPGMVSHTGICNRFRVSPVRAEAFKQLRWTGRAIDIAIADALI